MQSPPFPRYLVPPRSKYSPQHHVLKHLQLPFLPQCQRPSSTPIQNNRQDYSSLISWTATWKTKDSAPNDSKHFLTSVYSLFLIPVFIVQVTKLVQFMLYNTFSKIPLSISMYLATRVRACVLHLDFILCER